MRDIGKNIKALRTKNHMTQDELAERLFVTRQTVSNYETGRSRPDVEMLAKIADALETDLNTIIYGLPQVANRKWMYLKTAISVIASIVLALIYGYLDGITRELQYNFVVLPRYFVRVYYFSVLMLSIGWSAMQILSIFIKISPLSPKKAKWLCWGCLLFAGIYYIFVSSIFVQSFDMPRFWLYTIYFIMGVWPEGVAVNWAYLFLPLGSLLWLCSFHEKEKKNVIDRNMGIYYNNK